MSLEIRFSDEDIVVVSKPTLLLSVPGRGEEKQDCVVSRLAQEFPGVREVHRLDWETSGLMMLARNKAAHRELSRQFQEREVGKSYTAVVAGVPDAERGEVDLPLRCDWPNRPRQMVDPALGKPSLTRWERLSADADRCRLRLNPVTGRSHQLRVHLMAIGHPILGDRLYADPASLAMAGRLLLHATTLSFTHPLSGEPMHFCDEPPF
jgi:tRNA pseudouridine32 synthase/23S rRNA pseudouridine746 synthase